MISLLDMKADASNMLCLVYVWTNMLITHKSAWAKSFSLAMNSFSQGGRNIFNYEIMQSSLLYE